MWGQPPSAVRRAQRGASFHCPEGVGVGPADGLLSYPSDTANPASPSSAPRSSALIPFFSAGPSTSGSLHAGHRLANPGFPGFNSNSSEQTTQTLIGNAILAIILSTTARDSPQFPENN